MERAGLVIREDILTVDNLLHVLLGFVVMALAWLYLPLSAAAALYLREQGQAGSWTLGGSFHKFAEFFFPAVAIIVLWELWKWLG